MAETKKIVKKRWFPILAPKIFREQEIGETYVSDISTIVGRHVTVNLMSLTNDMKKQNTNVQFLITNVDGTKALTKVVSMEMVPAAIKRNVRRGRTRLDESFLVTTKDKDNIRIKPLIITRSITKSSVNRALRKMMIDMLEKTAISMATDNIFSEIISNKLQKTIKDKLNKIYPLRVFEVRSLKIETGSKKKTSSMPVSEVVEEPVEEPETEETPVEEKKEAKHHKKPEKKSAPTKEEKQEEVIEEQQEQPEEPSEDTE